MRNVSDIELESCVRRYRNTVFGTALCFVKNPSDADDIAQEVFIKLYKYDGEFDSDEHIRAWLIRCTVNLSKSLLRSYWHKFSAPLEEAENKVYYDKSVDADMLKLLNKLRPKIRSVLYLHYYEGYSAAEIAGILKISESAVMARLSRGRKQLRTLLLEERNESENGLQEYI